jgi:uncharacterized protein (DUF58 family)
MGTITMRTQWRWPLLWLLLLLLAALFLPARAWNSLLVGLGGLLLIAYGWARQLAHGLSADRQLRFGWVAVGDRLSEQFELRNDSFLPLLWAEIDDESNVPGYNAAVVRSVPAQTVDRWRQSAVCQRRGHYHLGPWRLRTADPFGIFQVTYHYPASSDIIIHPPSDTQLPLALPAGQSSGRQRSPRRAWEANLSAATARNYQPGDPRRWIHWPLSAHRAQLMVRQFDQDVGGDVWLLLDLEAAAQVGQGSRSSEEYAVLLAAALAAHAGQQNRAVGLAGYGREPQLIPPGRGQGQQWKILRALALLQADGDTTLAEALRDLNRIAQRGATALIISASDRADWLPNLLPLAQRGIHSHVILLDRVTFGSATTNAALSTAVRQMGFGGDLLRYGDLRPASDEPARRGFWEFKVLATGKVLTVRRPES